MTNLNALPIAERQIRVDSAPRCWGAPAWPRINHGLRLPRFFAWRRPGLAVCC